ncbi:hypothetical protein Pyn_01188 [Prunus yedoensis var. nudiflora]|uniref:Uncharacterized protein n=1 Tax=Prunus yedoensis var. nudiflora TaxID=2094558 RepID=A0A314ZTE5_PRUYE|nr:hypothetical protein Pyn_01188 [Prunus yedoensis var. nudiflora]
MYSSRLLQLPVITNNNMYIIMWYNTMMMLIIIPNQTTFSPLSLQQHHMYNQLYRRSSWPPMHFQPLSLTAYGTGIQSQRQTGRTTTIHSRSSLNLYKIST